VVLAMLRTATTFDAIALAGTSRTAGYPRKHVVLSEQSWPNAGPESPVT
jgi:hypothetical protein